MRHLDWTDAAIVCGSAVVIFGLAILSPPLAAIATGLCVVLGAFAIGALRPIHALTHYTAGREPYQYTELAVTAVYLDQPMPARLEGQQAIALRAA